jgi:hypothetical protein
MYFANLWGNSCIAPAYGLILGEMFVLKEALRNFLVMQ